MIIVQVLGMYMIIRYLDPQGNLSFGEGVVPICPGFCHGNCPELAQLFIIRNVSLT